VRVTVRVELSLRLRRLSVLCITRRFFSSGNFAGSTAVLEVCVLLSSLLVIGIVTVTLSLFQVNVKVTTADALLEFSIQQNTTGKQLFDQAGTLLLHCMSTFLHIAE